MYGFIGSSEYFKDIKQFVTSQDETITFKIIGEEIQIIETIKEIVDIKIKHLILDVASLADEIEIVEALAIFKEAQPKVQIILILPLKYIPGNLVMSEVVRLGIYDFIRHELEQGSIEDFLYDLVVHPTPYRKVKDWVNGQEEDQIEQQEYNNNYSNEYQGQYEEYREQEEYQDEEYQDEEYQEQEEYQDEEEYNQHSHRSISLPKINLPKLPKKEPITERTVTIIQEKIIGSVVIAVAGVQSRIGVTHTVIELSKLLKEDGYRVAVVEFHKSNSFSMIKNSYKDVVEVPNKNDLEAFNLDHVDYYPYSQELNILDVLDQDYNYIVLDMGIYNKCDITEYKRANVKLILSGVKDWELQGLTNILKLNDNLHKNKYLFNFASQKRFEEIQKDMLELPCYQVPMNPDPYEIEEYTREKFTEILKDVLPEKKASKKSSSPLSIFKKAIQR